MKIYVSNYKVYVYLGNCNRCSLAPLARENLVQPQNRSGSFTNFEVNRPLTKKRTQEGSFLGQAIDFRASAASQQCVNVSHKKIYWHVVTQKYLHHPEEPDAFIELLTEQSLHVINRFTQIALVRRSTMQREDQNRWENFEITGNLCEEI